MKQKTDKKKPISGKKKNSKIIVERESKLSSLLGNEKIALSFILSLTFLLYLRMFQNQLVNRDDFEYIVINPFIRHLDFPSLKAIFSTYYMGNYHPLSMFCFQIGYLIDKVNAWPYQIINLSLHLINTTLVFYFIKSITLVKLNVKGTALIPVIASLLFGIHTLNVESVAWVSENKNVLYTMFFLLSLILYLRFLETNNWRNYYLALFIFCLSLLSKAVAVTLPLVFILIDYFYGRKLLSRKVIVEKLPFLFLALIFGIVALFAQGKEMNVIEKIGNAGIYDKISIASYGIVHYILKVILPIKLSAFYEYPEGASTLLPLVFYFYPVFIILSSILLYKLIKRNSILMFGVLFFLINIVLLLQIISVGDALMADRYAYVPSIGLFFIIAYLINSLIYRTFWHRTIALAGFSIYLILLTTMTLYRISVWKDSIALWNDILIKSGNNPKSVAWILLAGLLNDEGHYELAFKNMDQFINGNPDNGIAYYHRAFARYNLNDISGAKEDLKKSEVLTKRHNRDLLNNWGVLKNKLGDYSGAIKYFDRAIKINPNIAEILNGRADAKIALNDFIGALDDLNSSIQLNPLNPDAYNNRGIVNSKLGKYKESFADYNTAISLRNNFLQAYQNRVDVRFLLNDYEGAILDLSYILNQAQIPYAYYYRGIAYMKLNKKAEACSDFKKAIELGYLMLDQEAINYCR